VNDEHFTFTDYSPMCYRHIRSFFSVDATQYRDVLCHNNWHNIPTPGKSAAQLFFCGQNWVIKTMTEEESKFLRSILHRYYYHSRDNPHTLLPHFVGHHSIQFTKSKEKITFVIMQNVFATPNKIHEKFDLKGSTVGRFATKVEKMKQTCTKKDLDINKPVVVGEQRRKLLIDQMKRDCDFLRKACIMDYSFLVGVHHFNGKETSARGTMKGSDMSPGASPEGRKDAKDTKGVAGAEVPEDGRCFTSDQGGMLRHDDGMGTAPEIYYVGIIDILQEYNLWKFSETCLRSITNDRHQISSVDPRDYAARFVDFMSSFIV
jgi:1-phosphatidylinositol-4-phosphate 5-kinase